MTALELTEDQDATLEYEPLHPEGTIEKYLPADKHLGPVEVSDYDDSHNGQPRPTMNSEARQAPLSVLQNLDDFEVEARKYLSQKAWVYYSSAAESLASHRSNLRDWERIHLRPRILRSVVLLLVPSKLLTWSRNVAQVSMKRTIMGHESALPFFVREACQCLTLLRCCTNSAARLRQQHLPS